MTLEGASAAELKEIGLTEKDVVAISLEFKDSIEKRA